MTLGRPVLAPTEASLVEILQRRAVDHPDRMIFCYLQDGEVESARFTYADLDRRARQIAAELQRIGQVGDRALLIYPPGLEFIAALFGCFYAGLIAVPVYPPRLGMQLDPWQNIVRTVRDCDPVAILVGEPFVDSLHAAATTSDAFRQRPIVSTEQIEDATSSKFNQELVTRDHLALLQYTSGSTGDPRGVMISHGNILENEFVIQSAFGHRTAERMGTGVCWLPFYHDMGLIGNVLQAVYVDAPCYLMSPLDMLQRPFRWLDAISRYQAHSSGGPNFAYDLCVSRITEAQKSTLDLSSWQLAAIGAEPISADVIDRFSAAFECCGFRREAFYPCYGLAEATLFVSGGEKVAEPIVRESPATRLVGCGHAWPNHEILIVDLESLVECAEGTVGEIWVRGPSVASGYWQRDQETALSSGAYLKNSDRGPFLRTGDLGFFDRGELFVTGRLKDLIIIRGQNHAPQDIEATVGRQHIAFKPNTAAAFGCPIDGEERLIILQEIDRASRKIDVDELRRDIRRVIAEEHQLQAFDIVFLRNGSLPKTTSGKIRRHECRQRYLANQLSLWTPAS